MKLAVSNIGFPKDAEPAIYDFLAQNGFSGLEIAPTRLFPENPYDHAKDFAVFAKDLKKNYGLTICSMQSIWYGVSGNIFNIEQRGALIDYTKRAIDFAAAGGCENLVFGCPKNRNMAENDAPENADEFFISVAEYANKNGCFIALEPNPSIYGTNFINTTKEALDYCARIKNLGLKVNIDFGTIVNNEENPADIFGDLSLISHIHISEPYLAPLQPRDVHHAVKNLAYNRYVSLEMATPDDVDTFKQSALYLSKLFL